MFRKRLPEWTSSLTLLGIGLVMLFWPVSFDAASAAAFKDYQIFWTVICLIVGVLRMIALVINGAWTGGTPFLRLVGSIVGASIFGAFVGNLFRIMDSTHVFWGVVTYGVLMIGELLSAWYSAKDMINYNRYGK